MDIEHPDNVPVEPGEGEMVETPFVEGESSEPKVASEQAEAVVEPEV